MLGGRLQAAGWRGSKAFNLSGLVKPLESLGLDLRIAVSDRKECYDEIQPKALAVCWRLLSPIHGRGASISRYVDGQGLLG